MFKRDVRGQGALEYLLILGAAIIVVAVVIFMMLGAATTAPTDDATNSIDSSFDQLRDLVPSNGGGGSTTPVACIDTSTCTSPASCGNLICQDWPGVGASAPDTMNLSINTIIGQYFGGSYSLVFGDYGDYKLYYSEPTNGTISFFESGEIGMGTGVTANNQWVLSNNGFHVISATSNEADGPFEANWVNAAVLIDGMGVVDNETFDGFTDGTWSLT